MLHTVFIFCTQQNNNNEM